MSLQSRLQSRISRRRNAIRFIEEDLASAKAARNAARSLSATFGLSLDLSELNEVIYESRKTVKTMADDQRLDKQLKNMLTLTNAPRRFYGLDEF